MSQSLDPAEPGRSRPEQAAVAVAGSDRSGGTGRRASLWRDRNFLTMWTGQAFAQFGAQITELALPVVAILALQATEMQVGVLNAAGVAAFLLVGLPAGAWIDRMRKRRVMMVADLVRALALACIPLLWLLDALQIWHLVVIALVTGIATVFFDVSYQSIVPSLVRPHQIAEANGKLESTAQLAGIAGPSVGGWLVGILAAPLAVLTTAVTYLVSVAALSRTRDTEVVEPSGHDPLRTSIAEGLRWVFGNRYLRRIVGTTATSNFFGTLTFTLLPLFLLRELGLSPVTMGVIFGLGAAGGFLGAVATPHMVRWIGEARAIPVSSLAYGAIGLLVPVAAVVPGAAVPVLIAQSFVGTVAVLVYNIVQVTFRQRITPRRLLGRMNASIRFVVWGVMPLSALLAGALGSTVGVVPTMWIAAIGGLASTLFVVVGPFWSGDLTGDVHDEPTGS